MLIETRLKDGWKINQIRLEIGCSFNAVKKEIKRGIVLLYNGNVERYKARAGQAVYEMNRQNSLKPYRLAVCRRFIEYVERHVEEDGWSLDACFGKALESGEFSRDEVVYTKTLYNYVDSGLMNIKKIDLPEKVSRKKHRDRCIENKHKLDDSIEERPESVEDREEFGHWEADSVLGKQGE